MMTPDIIIDQLQEAARRGIIEHVAVEAHANSFYYPTKVTVWFHERVESQQQIGRLQHYFEHTMGYKTSKIDLFPYALFVHLYKNDFIDRNE